MNHAQHHSDTLLQVLRSRSKSGLSLSCLLVAASMLLGCMGQLGAKAPPPATAGTHPVGVTTLEVKDEKRDRELAVEVWYPAANAPSAEEAKPVVYSVGALGGAVARLRSPTGAHRNVESWRRGGERPVVLLSHGAGSSRFANVSLAEVLASHGYVVAAPDHDGHTVADKVWGISESERGQSALDRPLDLSAVLDELEHRTQNGDRLFSGLIDMDRVAVAGHSFGGRTALALVGAEFNLARQQAECERNDDSRLCRTLEVFRRATEKGTYRYRDPRVKAALLITPAGFEFYREDGIKKIDAPALVVAAGRDQTTPYAERHKPLYEALVSPHYILDLKNAGHLTATDVCDIVASTGLMGRAFGGDKSKDGCGSDYLSTEQALEAVSNASLAFFELHLNQDASAETRLRVALGNVDGERVATTKPPSQL